MKRLKPRQYSRISLNLFANKVIDGEPYMVRLVNLSMGGALVYRLLEPSGLYGMGEVALEFELPGESKILMAGVRESWQRRSPHGLWSCGLEFLYMSKSDHRRLDQFFCRVSENAKTMLAA